MMSLEIHVATMQDCEQIRKVISDSAYGLSSQDYSQEVIASALTSIWGLDTQLIKDKTYFLVFTEGALAACGGWSFRQTLFGSDAQSDRDPARLNPQTDSARIRAFFVRPEYARRGIGTLLLSQCERAARDAGFHSLALGATLPGQRLYLSHGFTAQETVQYTLNDGSEMDVIQMSKDLVGS